MLSLTHSNFSLQVRFELTFFALDPKLHVVAPWREWDITGREDAIEYAKKHNVFGAITLCFLAYNVKSKYCQLNGILFYQNINYPSCYLYIYIFMYLFIVYACIFGVYHNMSEMDIIIKLQK